MPVFTIHGVRCGVLICYDLRFPELYCAGVMANTVHPRLDLYDASAPFRDRAMRGILHSGRLVRDPRSRDRTLL